MTDEEKDAKGNDGNNGNGGDSESSSRFSFLNRNEPNGSGGSGIGTDGSGSGKSTNSGSGSDGGSVQNEEHSGGIESESTAGTREDFGPSSGSGDDGRGGARGDGGEWAGHVKFARNCGCGGCRSRRANRGQEEPANYASATETGEKRQRRYPVAAVPESVDIGDIFPGLNDGKPVKVDSLFSLAYATVFDLIKLMRKEDHWELTKEEANKLGKVSVACMNTMPETKAKLVKKFEKQLPWFSLIGFGMVITYPRVLASMELAKEKKSNRFPAPLPFSGENRPAENLRTVPLGSERISTEPVSAGNKPTSGQSFPPGHGENFPEFDFKIPS